MNTNILFLSLQHKKIKETAAKFLYICAETDHKCGLINSGLWLIQLLAVVKLTLDSGSVDSCGDLNVELVNNGIGDLAFLLVHPMSTHLYTRMYLCF